LGLPELPRRLTGSQPIEIHETKRRLLQRGKGGCRVPDHSRGPLMIDTVWVATCREVMEFCFAPHPGLSLFPGLLSTKT